MSQFAAILAVVPPATPEFNATAELVRVILSLVGIIVLIMLAGWLTRRMQRRPGAGGRKIRCVESFAVGTRERILLLDADGKRLLIGVGPGGMRTLHVFDVAVVEEAPPATDATSAKPVFAELLARWRSPT